MCGRAYITVTEEELELRYLTKKPVRVPKLQPNYNFSPSQQTAVIFVQDDERQLDLFRWGLIPSWAKDEKIGYNMINARAETITEKPSFKRPFQKRRCIVPLSGFYEWQNQGGQKHPFAIFHRSEPFLSMAGIWETWHPPGKPDAPLIHSFALLTTEANSFMRKIHERMPVLIDRKDEEEWLDPNPSSSERLLRLLKPCPDEWLDAYEVSTAVNSPRNNRVELLTPLSNLGKE